MDGLCVCVCVCVCVCACVCVCERASEREREWLSHLTERHDVRLETPALRSPQITFVLLDNLGSGFLVTDLDVSNGGNTEATRTEFPKGPGDKNPASLPPFEGCANWSRHWNG